MLRCPMYKSRRGAYLTNDLISNEFTDDTNVVSILSVTNKEEDIFYFIHNIFNTRAFILNK